MTGPERTATTRGQTTQDFAVGIGIFLLAVTFVFAFLPTVVTPFDSTVGGEPAQAERIAATILEDVSTGQNEVNVSTFETRYGETDLDDELGLRSTDSVNVTITPVGETAPIENGTGGEPYDDRPGTSVIRIVTDDGDECADACELTVRVW